VFSKADMAFFSGDFLQHGGVGSLLEGTPSDLRENLLKIRQIIPETAHVFYGREQSLQNLAWAKEYLSRIQGNKFDIEAYYQRALIYW
jgi:glyoxylase-like metal-dependent hydrolase (beta-lactamase superfamily II)